MSQSPYRCSRYERETLRNITDELKECGQIRDSSSQYNSPVILVKKKNGDRMVIDYRRLNRQTVKDKFPLPIVGDMLDRLSGNNMFNVLDMANGYLQIPLSQESRHKAAFTTPDGR